MPCISRAAALGATLILAALPASGIAATLTVAEVESFYNVFTLSNATISNSSIGGRAAFGGNASISGYAIGGSASGVAPYALVSGGDLLFQNGSVAGGAIAFGGTSSISSAGYSSADHRSDVIDFSATMNALRSYSSMIAGAAPTGSVTGTTNLTLTGLNPTYNVFNLTLAQLGGGSSLTLATPSGSKAFINVFGAAGGLANFGFGGFNASNTIFNFVDATVLNLSSIGVSGTVLAPYADVVFQNGDLQGQLFANSLFGSSGNTGSIGNAPFSGYGIALDIAPVPEPSTYALLLAGFAMLFGIVGRRRRRSNSLDSLQ